MKNQYNFLKAIDTSSSSPEAREPSTSCGSSNSTGANKTNQAAGLKNGLSKLHNLVAAKFGASTHAPGAHRHPLAATGAPSKQRNARIFSLATSADGRRFVIQKPSSEANNMAHLVASAGRQVNNSARTRHLEPASEKHIIEPELAKCYDEIDQIYDYIRGLAPLPLNLRKIKSIDFEQIDRDKSCRQEHHQHQLRAAAELAHATGANLLRRKLARARQRDASDNDIGPPSEPNGAARQRQGAAPVQMPIRVTATTAESRRPSIKRVESLNLGAAGPVAAGANQARPGEPLNEHEPGADRRPSYQISATRSGQLFRLPRAHSTSTLNKPPSPAECERPGAKPAAEAASRTLPAARLPRCAASQAPGADAGSLCRSRRASGAATKDLDEAVAGAAKTGRGGAGEPSASRPGSSSDSSSSGAAESSAPTTGTTTSDDSTSSASETNQRKWRRQGREPKSHSDYENDSCASGSAQGRESARWRAAETNRRTPSSGQPGSVSGDSVSKSAAKLLERAERHEPAAGSKHEHIYEQIPAHRHREPLAARPVAQQRPQGPGAAASRHEHSLIRQHQRPALISYPVAYSANVAAGSASRRQQQQAAALRQARQLSSLFARLPGHLGAPNSLQRPAPSRPLADAHRHRLSMGNLNVAAALPLASILPAPLYQRHQAQLDSRLSRSASSGKVNRAPRLSPGQLIAQIQMPRAVSKRQVDIHAGQQQHQAPAEPQQAATRFVWQRHSSAADNRDQKQVESGRQQQPAADCKRASSRRLTAIGIEQAALDLVRDGSPGAPPASSGDPAARHLAGRIESHQVSGGYFEPPQLLKAPLIDDDDPDTPDTSSCSGVAGERADFSVSDNNMSAKIGLTSASGVHQSVRCMNSISDLHSFSSQPTSDEEEADETQDEARGSLARSSDKSGGSRARSSPANEADQGDFVSSRSFIKCYYGRERAAGRAHPTTTGAGGPQRGVAPGAQADTSTGQPDRPARRLAGRLLGGERLLSLIGLDIIGSSQKADRWRQDAAPGSARPAAPPDRKAGQPAAAAAARRTSVPAVASTPVAAMFAAAIQQQQRQRLAGHQQLRRNSRQSSSSALVGEFLSSDGPILVRDRRIAALRHYKHPTVKVAKVPGAGAPAGQAAECSPGAGATATTTSTSSYEAAIKRSGSREPAALSRADGRPAEPGPRQARPVARHSARASAGQQAALISVPKLSKQSHLINRPLPRLPALVASQQEAARGQSGAGSGPGWSQGGRAGGRPAAARQQAGGKPRAERRQSLVSTNLDAPGEPPSDDQGPGRPTKQVAGLCKPASLNGGCLAQMATHPSPTVTTYTSSGISSRLTAGTQLAPPSSASSQRSASSRARAKTDELANGRRPLRGAQCEQDDADDERARLDSPEPRAGQQRGQPLPAPGDQTQATDAGAQHQLLVGQRATSTNNLRLFDEKFSAKFIDQQLASSNDSLLESINFSGTLKSQSRRDKLDKQLRAPGAATLHLSRCLRK